MKPNRTLLLQLSLVLGLALVFLSQWTGTARAVEFDTDGVVTSDEVIDDDVFFATETTRIDGVINGDVFVNSNHTIINGTINGNLVAFNAILTLNGEVKGSLVTAGRTLELNGPVQGSVYAASYSIVLQPAAAVARNLISACYSLETQAGSTVGRDLLAANYQTLIYGEVGRDLTTNSSALELGGQIGRNVTADVEAPSNQRTEVHIPFGEGPDIQAVDPGLRVEENARIGGKLTYTSSQDQADSIASPPAEGVVFQAREDPVTRPARATRVDAFFAWGLNLLRSLATLLALGGLIYWRIPALLRSVTGKAQAQPLPAAGWGLVSLAGGFVLALGLAGLILVLGILMGVITLGGLSLTILGGGYAALGLAVVVFLFLVVFGSKLIFANLIGQAILNRLAPTLPAYYGLGIGIILYVFFSSVPIVGWIVALTATLVGLGAIWLAFKDSRQPAPEPVTPPVVPV